MAEFAAAVSFLVSGIGTAMFIVFLFIGCMDETFQRALPIVSVLLLVVAGGLVWLGILFLPGYVIYPAMTDSSLSIIVIGALFFFGFKKKKCEEKGGQ